MVLSEAVPKPVFVLSYIIRPIRVEFSAPASELALHPMPLEKRGIMPDPPSDAIRHIDIIYLNDLSMVISVESMDVLQFDYWLFVVVFVNFLPALFEDVQRLHFVPLPNGFVMGLFRIFIEDLLQL